MKTFKTSALTTLAFSGLALFATGAYNTAVMQDTSFMNSRDDIRFAKRLDEFKGEVVVGRVAASVSWNKLTAPSDKDLRPESSKEAVKQLPQEDVAAVASKIAEPAIKEDLDLTATKVYYKDAFANGSFSGYARTVDGVVEEVFVSLPDGNLIEINTNDRMQGNVFQYEDYETRELKSGLLYQVRPGAYMITLANHSKYPGVRMEFTTGEASAGEYGYDYYEDTQGWGMNNQNHQSELADQADIDQAGESDYSDAHQTEVYEFNFKS